MAKEKEQTEWKELPNQESIRTLEEKENYCRMLETDWSNKKEKNLRVPPKQNRYIDN